MAKICDQCDRPMVRRKSVKGEFYGCSGYPECKNIVDIPGTSGKSTTNVDSVAIKHESTCNTVMNKTEKPHSYEFGAAGNRHKIYYGDVRDLVMRVAELVEAGLATDPNEIKPMEFGKEEPKKD